MSLAVGGQLADTAAYAVAGGRHGRHLESVTSYQKSYSINRYLFTRRTILPNCIQIQFETSEQ